MVRFGFQLQRNKHAILIVPCGSVSWAYETFCHGWLLDLGGNALNRSALKQIFANINTS